MVVCFRLSFVCIRDSFLKSFSIFSLRCEFLVSLDPLEVKLLICVATFSKYFIR